MSLLAPLVELFRYSLQPIAPFTWLGWGISTLDVVATVRLCIALRQIREIMLKQHAVSFVKKTPHALVVYGGEALTCMVIGSPLLGVPPSFVLSGWFRLYTAIQALVEYLPSPSSMGLRARIVVQLDPPAVTANASPAIASSPWTLLVTSLLQPYGWTTADLWCAPTVTGLYALLTHAQPFWAELHLLLAQVLGGGAAAAADAPPKPLDPETARAVCAVLLASLFVAGRRRTLGSGSLLRRRLGLDVIKCSSFWL
ncbi:hypothetical protein BJ912DRAFT_1022480 [Pholiota molesta]|nr:hypothetical protein BJ912DRAFT_1022480 [Pholiota molesta]